MRKLISLIAVVLSFVLIVSPKPTSINAFGTTLQSLTSNLNSRIFNDLMKQSLPIVPYQVLSYGVVRCWSGCPLSFINNLTNQYPSTLQNNVYAVAEIPFYGASDANFLNQNLTISFSGAGKVGVVQGSLNQNWTGGIGTFILPSINSSLFVYIYNSTAGNPITNIKVYLTSLSPLTTYTSNFISYLQPFNILRTCFWQGQNLYSSGQSLQIWANRTLTTSSTQISWYGVALEHILEL